MSSVKVISAGRVFTGEKWLQDHAVVMEGNRIIDVVPSAEIGKGIESVSFPDGLLAPAFMDLQIYGAHGKLLAVYPEPDSLKKLVDYCREGGAYWCMPTVATNATTVFHQCIDAIRAYWDTGGEGVLGLHVEGPWINPKKKGAHLEAFIHAPSLEEVKALLDYGKDVIRIITLAPEICSHEVVDYIMSKGIVVSAGHSNATYKEAMQAFDRGIPAATHLFNAMSPLQHREPGLVGAVFNHDSVRASIIPDGHHVDYAAIRIAKKMLGERLFVITDAVTHTDKGPYQHQLAGDKYEAAGILSGSALTLHKAVQNLVNHTGIELAEALRMCSLYPARVMNMQNRFGKIQKGYDAAMVILDAALNVIRLAR
jgi:N-acetylglucosamine-6-phosphate deacetylase